MAARAGTLKAFKEAGYRVEALSEMELKRTHASHHTEEVFADAVEALLRRSPQARLYGVELELPVNGSLMSGDKYALCEMGLLVKTDGSLRDRDIELNFPPLSASYLRRAKVFDAVKSIMEKYGDPTGENTHDVVDEGFSEDDDEDGGGGNHVDPAPVSYGVHIHSNALWMRRAAAALVVAFVRKTPEFFKWLSGREGYSSYGSPYSDHSKRWAACFTTKGTIEYRMFRGSYDQRELEVWLSVIQAVEDWIALLPEHMLPVASGSWRYDNWEVTSFTHRATSLEAFSEFLGENATKYHLAARAMECFLVDRETYAYGIDYDTSSLYARIDEVYVPAPKRPRKKAVAVAAVPAMTTEEEHSYATEQSVAKA